MKEKVAPSIIPKVPISIVKIALNPSFLINLMLHEDKSSNKDTGRRYDLDQS